MSELPLFSMLKHHFTIIYGLSFIYFTKWISGLPWIKKLVTTKIFERLNHPPQFPPQLLSYDQNLKIGLVII